jgi:hypothetical protein
VKCGVYETQVDIRNTWPDNSLKFAQVTCKPTRTIGNIRAVLRLA